MKARDHVVQDLDALDEHGLEYAARLIETLRSRPPGAAPPSFDPAIYGPLYREFASEDRQLADEGMADYTRGLEVEDKA